MPITMDLDAHYSGGNAWARAFIGRKLTDRRIAKYEAEGFYLPEARRQRLDYRKKREELRKAKAASVAPKNFILGDDGRLIYAP